MHRLLIGVCAVAAVLLVGWRAVTYRHERGEAEAALAQCALVVGQAQELMTLRSAAPPEARRRRPAPGIAARLASVVALAGLPQGSLQSVTPEMESPVNPGTGGNSNTGPSATTYRRTAVRLILDPITLPQLGRFFAQWRKAEPDWTVSAIELAPTSAGPRGTLPAGETRRPLRVGLTLETVFANGAGEEGAVR